VGRARLGEVGGGMARDLADARPADRRAGWRRCCARTATFARYEVLMLLLFSSAARCRRSRSRPAPVCTRQRPTLAVDRLENAGAVRRSRTPRAAGRPPSSPTPAAMLATSATVAPQRHRLRRQAHPGRVDQLVAVPHRLRRGAAATSSPRSGCSWFWSAGLSRRPRIRRCRSHRAGSGGGCPRAGPPPGAPETRVFMVRGSRLARRSATYTCAVLCRDARPARRISSESSTSVRVRGTAHRNRSTFTRRVSWGVWCLHSSTRARGARA
jgi:hypothetical protein